MVNDLEHCRPLFNERPDSCMPYMLTLYPDHLSLHFYRLKQLGDPICRREIQTVSDYQTADAYRQRFVYLPCYQLLAEADPALRKTVLREAPNR